jgi:hypothetical protein
MEEITTEEQIYNWMTIGFSQPVESLNELFYYDRSDNQFFSVLFIDYFHFDEDFNIEKGITSGYPESILKKLAERMKRIENNSPDIIALERAKKGEILNHQILQEKINNFLKVNAIDIKTTTVWEIDTESILTVNLTENKENKKKWWKFWS